MRQPESWNKAGYKDSTFPTLSQLSELLSHPQRSASTNLPRASLNGLSSVPMAFLSSLDAVFYRSDVTCGSIYPSKGTVSTQVGARSTLPLG